MSTAPRRFRVAWTGDFFAADGTPRFHDLGTSVFDGQAHLECVAFPEHRPVIAAEQSHGGGGWQVDDLVADDQRLLRI